VVLGEERLEQNVKISPATQEVLSRLHKAVTESVRTAIQAVSQNSEESARIVIDMKGRISELTDSAAMHQAKRLVAEEPNRLAAYTLEIDLIERFKRIYYFAKRMAKTVVAEEPTEAMSASTA
jgi:phosphate:Na+ symporter